MPPARADRVEPPGRGASALAALVVAVGRLRRDQGRATPSPSPSSGAVASPGAAGHGLAEPVYRGRGRPRRRGSRDSGRPAPTSPAPPTRKDVEAMWGAADGTVKLIEGLMPNIEELEGYPHTAELGAAYRASFPVMLEGATQIRDSITAGDSAGVVAGSQTLGEGVVLYGKVRRDAPALHQRRPEDEALARPVVHRRTKSGGAPSAAPRYPDPRPSPRAADPDGRPERTTRGRPINLGGGHMTRTRIGALVAATAIIVAACGGATPSSAPSSRADGRRFDRAIDRSVRRRGAHRSPVARSSSPSRATSTGPTPLSSTTRARPTSCSRSWKASSRSPRDPGARSSASWLTAGRSATTA